MVRRCATHRLTTNPRSYDDELLLRQVWRRGGRQCPSQGMHIVYARQVLQRQLPKESKHKNACKLLHDEALFKDPPSKEECPICFLPMPVLMILCILVQPATESSVLIANIAG